MARHIVAVCVVCLLCADRLPCQQHVEDDIFAKQADMRISPSTVEYNNHHQQQQQQNNIDLQSNAIAYPNKRRKRHAGHSTSPQLQPQYTEITEKFLQRIFDEYGQADGTIHYKDFQRMLRQLGLQQLLEQKLTKANETCISDATLVQHVKPHAEHEHHEHDGHGSDCMQQQQHEQQHTSEESRKDCNDELCKQQAAAQHKAPTNYTLGKQDMLSLCPVLLYQLTAATDSERNGCIENSLLSDIDCHDDIRLDHIHDDKVHVWFYAFISVLACSILGLVGVAIIPFMDSRFYKHIIQFFVALAVGTMTGDALLHLLPHSLAGQSETNMIFKGLTCMGGIIFFYITEHGLTMISEWRRRIEKQEQTKPARAKVMHDPDSSIHTQAQSGDKLCKSKYSSYPYCYDEIAMAIKKEDRQQHNNCSNNEFPARNCSKRNSRVEPDSNEPASQSLLSTSHNHYAPIAETGHHHAHNHHQHCSATTSQMVTAAPTDSNNIATDIDGNAIGDGASISRYANGGAGDSKDIKPSSASTNDAKDEPVTVILREHESQHHGHSHKHGHVHSPPTSLSSVAWMIIMGDGLHNFTDGMAIGAAFAENIAGGFSTSLAVFCHELPHELGDFAILIKAGMSIRSAVYYNLLTGVLSFIGMIFGLVFGQTPEAAQWMFAAAAGLFIYIALVDMMPELSAPHKSLRQLVLQILGMSSGVLIMLLIAIYEGDLMSVFANTSLASSKPGY